MLRQKQIITKQYCLPIKSQIRAYPDVRNYTQNFFNFFYECVIHKCPVYGHP
jgi:hypothetical protein